MSRVSHPLVAAAVTLLASAAPALAPAQAAAPAAASTRSFVQIVRLRPEMVTEWMDLQRNEVVPALKKAGVASRITLATQVGNAFEYVLITPFSTWALMDGPATLARALGAEAAAQLNAKLRRCILTQTSYMATRVDSLSIAAGDALVWRTVVQRAMPGKMPEFLAHYRTEILPGMQKAKAAGKIAGSTIAIRGVGVPSGEFTTTTHYARFADLEGGNPLLLAFGQQAVNRINAKSATLSTVSQVVVRRRLADLSF